MQTMEQMQNEMLKKARWDGGYPKAIHVGLGIIALAHNEDDEKRLRKNAMVTSIIYGIALVGVCLFGIACFVSLIIR
jgi:hypothetical protein